MEDPPGDKSTRIGSMLVVAGKKNVVTSDYDYHGCNRWTTGSESSALPQGYACFGRLSIHHSGLAAC